MTENIMDPFKDVRPNNQRSNIALLIASLAVVLSLIAFFKQKPSDRPAATGVPSVLKVMRDTGTLNAGYGVYPPYTNLDPNTKAVTGFSIDLVERIAKDLGVRVAWHRVSWNTFIPDIKRGEYDLIADPILTTIPRVTEFSFTVPYDYFADGVVVVRAAERRFQSFEDLNQPGIHIAVGKGFASETIARSLLPKSDLVLIQMGTDMQQLFNEVASGRVDATISEGPSAERYLKEHPTTVKSINIESPPARIPGCFALRPDDSDGARAFSVALDFLKSTGEMDALRKKWGLSPLKRNQ